MNAGDFQQADVKKAFGRVLRRYRQDRDLSQEKLAELCGLHFTYISMMETGRYQPSLTVLLKLTAGMKLDSGELIEATRREYEMSTR